MRSRPLKRLLLLGLLSALPLFTGCRAVRTVAAKYPAPDLEQVYLPTAQSAEANAERNPVVVIPGFGGSEIRDAEGRTVWGARFTDDALSFSRPEGLRALALQVPPDFVELSPEEAAARLYRLDDDAAVTGPMLFFRTEVLAEVEFPVYAGLLVGLAKAGYRLEPPALADQLKVPRNPDGAPCFVFSYDWRRDLAGSAAELGAFLDRVETQVQDERRRRDVAGSEPVRFDIVAHSMAGLITRYYLRYGARDVLLGAKDEIPKVTWEGARRVDRAILVSPPNRGTAKALRNLANGDDSFWMPAYEPALVATWVSVPQMFPPREPGLLRAESGEPLDLDYFDISVWREHHWGPFRREQSAVIERMLPEISEPDERLRRLDALLEASLLRGERFVRAMNSPASPPPRTTIHLFTGDADPTLARGRALWKADGLRLVFEESNDADTEPGDGSVTRRSALADLRPASSRQWLRSSVPWTSVVFLSDRHAGFLANRVFQDNLLHLLLETPPSRFDETQDVTAE